MPFGYSVYGIRVQSDCPFPEFKGALSPDRSALDRIAIRVHPPDLPSESDLNWQKHNHLAYGFTRAGSRVFIRSPEVGTIEVDPPRRLIRWNPQSPAEDLGRIIVRGRALGLFLSYSPRCFLLHANALVCGGRAFALCGQVRQGKSTLSASLLDEEKGFEILSDDLVVISRSGGKLKVHPGPPEIRLWPESLEQIRGNRIGIRSEAMYPETTKRRCFVGGDEAWRHRNKAAPLSRIYILARGAARKRVSIDTLGGSEAILSLLAQTYMPVVSDPVVSRRRLMWASQIVKTIPVRRLMYPSGFEHLSKVREAIVKDVRAG